MTAENKTPGITVLFPKFREVLLKMAKDDQMEIRGNFHAISKLSSKTVKVRRYAEIAKHEHSRAHEMVAILDVIKAPTIGNIGLDGCEALLLITQHSYLAIMKKVLGIVEELFSTNPHTIPVEYIPALKDRVLILEGKKQLYGTQWALDETGKPFLIAVQDFPSVNKRRALYGLKPVRRPVNLAIGAVKYPLGRGLAKQTDQKYMSKEEYKKYSENYLKSKV